MRRILPIGLAIYFLCFTVLAVLLRGAAPGPAAQTVQGVRLGSWDGAAGTAYFSGKRLDCARDNADSPYGETCRIAIAGDELVLAARERQPGADSQLFFDLVRSNRLAMWRGSAMAVPPQPDGPLQPAPLPHGLQSQSCYDYADSPTWAYYINAQSQHVQASWLWVRFLADQLPVANYLTPRRSLLASDTFRDQVGAEAQAVYMAAANCQPATSASSLETAMPHAWRARIWLAQALDAVIWQDADADTELAAAQHTAEAYLACYQACPDPADVNCAHACMIATDPATEKLFVTP